MPIIEKAMKEEVGATGIDLKQKTIDLIQHNRAASLATVDSRGVPHVAVAINHISVQLFKDLGNAGVSTRFLVADRFSSTTGTNKYIMEAAVRIDCFAIQ